MTDCEALERIITAYVDGEATPAEREFVAAHLRSCERCRAEVEAESTARHVLRAHAAVARTMGVAPAWRPHAWRLGRPALPGSPAGVIGAVVATAAIIAFMVLQPSPVTAVGVIGDSRCGSSHGGDSERGHSCALNCVKRGAEFVLVADGKVYRIDNQRFPGLDAFANRRVAVTGAISDDVLKLRQIAPATDKD